MSFFATSYAARFVSNSLPENNSASGKWSGRYESRITRCLALLSSSQSSCGWRAAVHARAGAPADCDCRAASAGNRVRNARRSMRTPPLVMRGGIRSRLGEHLLERLDEQDERIRLFDQARVRTQTFELRRLGGHARKNDHRHVRRRRHHDVASRPAAQPQIDDRGDEPVLAQLIEAFV